MIKHIKTVGKIITLEKNIYGELLIPFNSIVSILISRIEPTRAPKFGRGEELDYYEYNGLMLVTCVHEKERSYYVDYQKAKEWFLDENGGCFEITFPPIKAI